MERKPRARIMKARALTDPDPEFVSMVRAGAQQEPLRVVKMDTAQIVPLFETGELTMKDAVKKAKASGHDIAQLVFKGGAFSDRASVDAWLKEGGFESGYEVTETKTKSGDAEVSEFTVASTSMKFETGSIRKVKGNVEGLTVFVGKVEGGEVVEKTEEEATAEKAEAKGSTITAATTDEANATAKSEAAASEAPEAAKTEKTAETGTEAVSEAAKDIAPLATVATDEEVKAKADGIVAELRTKSMYDVSSLGSVLSTLRWMVYDAEYGTLPETAVTSIKAGAKNLLEALVVAMNDAVGDYIEAFKMDTQKTAPAATETPAPAATTATKSDATSTAPAAVEPAPVATPDPALLEVLKGIQGAVETLTQTVKAQGEEIAEVKTKAAELAEEASNKGQTRKGADVTEQVTAPTAAPTKDQIAQKHAERRLRSVFGSYRGVDGFGG